MRHTMVFYIPKTDTGMPCKLSSPKDVGGVAHEVLAVNLNWNDDEWNCNDYDFDNDNPWNEGNVFLFFDTVHFLLPLAVRGFCLLDLCFNAVFPTAENLADFLQFF